MTSDYLKRNSQPLLITEKAKKFVMRRLIEDNRNNVPTANDSFGSKSTQLISKINTEVVVSTKDNWDKQIDDTATNNMTHTHV